MGRDKPTLCPVRGYTPLPHWLVPSEADRHVPVGGVTGAIQAP